MSEQKIHAITMPKWGLTMEEGTIVEWLIKEGDDVEDGSEILEISTDKITQAVESNVAGVLRRIIAEEDEEYPVQALLGVIADAQVSDEEIDAFIASHRVTDTTAVDAEEQEVSAAPAAQATTTKAMSRMRATIAKTVTASWEIPQFPVTMRIEMAGAKAWRTQLKDAGKSVSMNDIVTKACAIAIQKYPMVNARLTGKEYLLNPAVNIAIAVGIDDDLMMPVIKNCEKLTLEALAQESSRLITKVKDGTIGENDLTDGNFSVSNLGMYGIEQFAALVPPGMAAILAVGGIIEEPVVQAGKIVPATIMRVTLMSDHRIVDGVYAANFLVELKRLLENPAEL